MDNWSSTSSPGLRCMSPSARLGCSYSWASGPTLAELRHRFDTAGAVRVPWRFSITMSNEIDSDPGVDFALLVHQPLEREDGHARRRGLPSAPGTNTLTRDAQFAGGILFREPTPAHEVADPLRVSRPQRRSIAPRCAL